MQINQGTRVHVRAPIAFKINGKGRVVRLEPKHVLWVTNTKLDQAKHGVVMVGRTSHHIGQGYAFTAAQFAEYFTFNALHAHA